MVDNLAEKVDECQLNWSRYVLFAYNWDQVRKVSIIQSSGVSAIHGVLMYLSQWKDSWDFQNCQLYRWHPLLRGVR